jgi:hypothetical protein
MQGGTLFFPQGARILQRLSADPAGTTVYNYLVNDQGGQARFFHLFQLFFPSFLV